MITNWAYRNIIRAIDNSWPTHLEDVVDANGIIIAEIFTTNKKKVVCRKNRYNE